MQSIESRQTAIKHEQQNIAANNVLFAIIMLGPQIGYIANLLSRTNQEGSALSIAAFVTAITLDLTLFLPEIQEAEQRLKALKEN